MRGLKNPETPQFTLKNILEPRKENKEEIQFKVFKKTVIQICRTVLTVLVTERL